MKRSFPVTVNIEAYSQADAQAKMQLLLQMGAFVKDFNVSNLAGAVVSSFVISKVSEIAEKQKLGGQPEKQQPLMETIFPNLPSEKKASEQYI